MDIMNKVFMPKSNVKQIVKIITAMLFVLFSIAVTEKTTNVVLLNQVDASSTWDYTISNDGATITGYNGTSKSVVIPASLEGYTVVKIDDFAFEDHTMTSVTIPEGITSIGFGAFRNCKYLTDVYFNAANCDDCSHGSANSNSYSYSVFYNAGMASTGIQVTFGTAVKRLPNYLFSTGEDENNKVYANINKVIMSDGIEVIGIGAFNKCYALEDVTWSNTIKTIGEFAFKDCCKMQSAIIPTTVTSIGVCAFQNCKSLISIEYNAINCEDCSYGSNNTNSYAYSAFYNVGTADTGIKVTFGTAVKRIPAYLFSTGEDEINKVYANIKIVEMSDSIEEIGTAAFNKCYALEDVSWGNAVKTIGASAFEDCYKMKTVMIPASTTSIGVCTFKNCKSLTQIAYNAINCEDCDYGSNNSNSYSYAAFYNVGADSSELVVTFGSSVKKIPAYLFSTGEDYSYGSGDFARITAVVMSDSIEQIGKFSFYNCYELLNVDWGNNIQAFGESAFQNCIKIASIKIPETTISIEKCAFSNCKALKTIEYNAKNVNDCNYGSVNSNSYYYSVFYNVGTDNSELIVTFGDSVKKIPAYLFATGENYNYGDGGYAHITAITIPSSVIEIGKYAFNNCYDLKTINVKSKTATYGDNSFENVPTGACFYCYRNSTANTFAKEKGYAVSYYDPAPTVELKKSYTIGNAKYTVLSMDGSVPTVEYCPVNKNVKSIAIPNVITINGVSCKVTKIKNNAFKNCTKLEKVIIGKNILEIGTSAFYGCKKLTSVTMGANIVKIGRDAFKNCTSLRKITIPAKVTKIGVRGFYGCKRLTNLTIKTSKLTTKNTGKQAFTKAGSSNYKKLTVRVPKSKLKAYKRLLKKKGLSKKVKVKK